jgi:hypothetical protein
MLYRQSKIVYKPVVGITNAKTTRLLSDKTQDTYDSVTSVICKFIIENVGSLPAKNFKIKPQLKIGNTILPHSEQDENYQGTILIPKVKANNYARINKDTLNRMIQTKERLIYTIEIFYSDWEDYQKYAYKCEYEIKILKKEPLHLAVYNLSAKLIE